ANQGNSVNNWTGTKTFTQCSDMNAHNSICSSWEDEIEPKMLALQTSSSSEKCKNYSAGILDCYNKCLDKAKSLHLSFMEFNCEEADRKVDDLRRQEDQLKRDLKEIEDKKSQHGDCLQE